MQVHNATSPDRGMRPILAGLLLLAGTTALAGGMAWSRAQRVLGDHFNPPGWEVSLQIPKHFHPDLLIAANAASFKGLTPRGHAAQLIVWRIPLAVPATALEVVRGVMVQYELTEDAHRASSSRTRSQQRMGIRAGEQLLDDRRSVVARAIVVSPDLAFALSLRVVDHRVDRRTYLLFEKVCRSIVFAGAARDIDAIDPDAGKTPP